MKASLLDYLLMLLQLIQAVLFSVQVYWSRHFIFPKRVIKAIDQICFASLWKGKLQKATGGRVSLKDLISWNKVCAMRLVWVIIMKSGSLGIAWLHAYTLRGTDFWEAVPKSSSSWIWKSILKLWDIAVDFVEVQNGERQWKFSKNRFRIADVWNELRPKAEKVPWSRMIWCSSVPPIFSFICWLAILDRLPTSDRLNSWGLNVQEDCILCNTGKEFRDHIFF